MKNLSLGIKIAFGFAIVLMFLCIVAFIGFKSLSGVVDRVEKADDMNSIVKTILEARRHEKNYIIRGGETYINKVEGNVEKLVEQAMETKGKFNRQINKDQMDQVIEKVNMYSAAFEKYEKSDRQKAMAMEEMRSMAREALAQTEAIRADQKQQLAAARKNGEGDDVIDDRLEKADDASRMINLFMDSRKNEKEFIISAGESKWKDSVDKNLVKIFELSNDLKSRFENNKNIEQINAVIAAIQAYDKAFKTFAQIMKEQKNIDAEMVVAARAANKLCMEARADQKIKMENQISIANKIIVLGATIAALLSALFAFLITRSITGPVNFIIKGLSEGAGQVASAAGQVSSASQSLAGGSSQQAASIEETSASMEEMSSITKQNAENSIHADTLMKDSNKVVKTANESMDQLTRSMEDISRASEETSKIIKTIDEIAFQTNLLALNAAVEAARAGEAGAGFAVVADEVRNLAMRSAKAAKNTAELIEGTVKKVSEGSKLVSSTNEAFARVAESSVKVGDLIAEISGASDEQANGIEQVNIAISEMDKVVQQNAANAEESASASEEMNAQAEQLKDYVEDLVKLVTGKTKGISGRGFQNNHNISFAPEKEFAVKKRAMLSLKNEVKPEQLIPFEEDEFKDF
ncbi:methyl-accepting chemotaxis protein [Desulfobacula phenolica]|uniref:Methyl-accepting chemotaxis protein n=1 Tax=Desulfobacula phenolica TaxID=90732 RepID=A0A1H2DQI4_9BACT|nr:methyl-accepting chemotaxis protein [Desulfobacula phenolica]SDT85001.1 methyl-accepting chemotaxis protein [Desulfobacula phenolica]